MINLEIGDIVEFLMDYQGYFTFSAGTKAEVVGTGRDGVFYVRLLGNAFLLEINANEKNPWFRKIEGSKVVK